MSNAQPIFDYTDESHGERLTKKAKDSPFMIIGKQRILRYRHIQS